MTFTETCAAHIEAREKLGIDVNTTPRAELLNHWQSLPNGNLKTLIRDRILWLEGGDYRDKTEADIALIASARLILQAEK